MKKILFHTILLLLSVSTSNAQVSGYNGKRFVIKADVIAPLLENGTSMHINYVISRKISIYGGVNFTRKNHKQNIAPTLLSDFPIEKAQIRDNQFEIGVNYFLSNAIPAPKGMYGFAQASYGIAQASGYYYNTNIYEQLPENTLLRYEVKGMKSTKFSSGFGMQYIISDLFVIDYSFGFTFGQLKTSPVVPDEKFENYDFLFDNFEQQYGPNLYSIGRWSRNPGGFGLQTNLKIGFIF